ncbi:MAG: DUF2799 domain-containing protein [Rhodospirillaceae bacterium]|nr:DUF2799 domain-containing protein [Rhodospirillaceae bacterium]
MNKNECLTADWRTIGFHDGADGQTASTIDSHRQACAEYGVVPNLDRYLNGRNDGLKEYCRPARGYQEGLAGHTYGGVCPSKLEKAFVAAHKTGFRIHEMESDIRNQERTLRDKERHLKDAHKALAEAQSTIIASNDPKARARALADLQTRTGEKKALERDIENLKRRIDRLKQQLDQNHSGADTRYQ